MASWYISYSDAHMSQSMDGFAPVAAYIGAGVITITAAIAAVPVLYLARVRPAGLTALAGTADVLTYAAIARQQWLWAQRPWWPWWPTVEVCCAAVMAWLAAVVTDRHGHLGLRIALFCSVTATGVAAWALTTWVF